MATFSPKFSNLSIPDEIVSSYDRSNSHVSTSKLSSLHASNASDWPAKVSREKHLICVKSPSISRITEYGCRSTLSRRDVKTSVITSAPKANSTEILGDKYFAVDKRPVVLFDGVCNLCNKWVNFLLDWDPEGHLRFAALQSEAGKLLLQRSGRSLDDKSDIVLVKNDEVYIGSDAVFQMASYLKSPFPAIAAAGLITPHFLKDAVYKAISENRYKVFGMTESCRLFDENFQNRFLS